MCTDECKDEVTLLSPYVVNGKQSACGSTCFGPIVAVDSIEINYGSSHCCHNHGFRLSSFCSAPVDPQPVKRDTARVGGFSRVLWWILTRIACWLRMSFCSQDSCSDEGIVEVPEDGKLQYLNQTIYVTFPSQEVIMYEEIQLLFIEDKLGGNSIYTDTGVEALYGCGKSIHSNTSAIVQIDLELVSLAKAVVSLQLVLVELSDFFIATCRFTRNCWSCGLLSLHRCWP